MKKIMQKSRLMTILGMFILLTGLLGGCGGGGDGDNDSTSTLSGTAATGAPIEGVVNVTDSKGTEVSVTIDDSGNYTVDVTGMTPPFILQAVATDSTLPAQYSFASQSNIRVNITQLTTLALYNAYSQQDLGTLQSNWSMQFSSLTQQEIDSALEAITTNFIDLLSDQGLDPAAFNIFSSSFEANGTGFDALLDSLSLTLNSSEGTSTITIDGAQFSFDFGVDECNTEEENNIQGCHTGGNNTGGNTSGSSITFSGPGVSSIVNNTYTPISVIQNPGLLAWRNFVINEPDVAVIVTVGFNIFTREAITASVTQATEHSITWVKIDASGLAGISLGGSTVTFTNVELPSNTAPNITLNGTLNY